MNTEDTQKRKKGVVAPYVKTCLFIVSILAVFCLLVLFMMPGIGGDGLFGQNGNTPFMGRTGGNPNATEEGSGSSTEQEVSGGSNTPNAQNGPDQQNNNAPTNGENPQKSQANIVINDDDVMHIGRVKQEPVTPPQQSQVAQNVTGKGLGKDGRGFFGQKLNPKENIWFVVDVSPSMLNPTSEGMSRLDALKIQLRNAIGKMNMEKSRKKYGIQPFGSTTLQNYPSTRQFARFSEDPKEVEQYIDNLNLRNSNGTPMMDAWVKAIQIINASETIDAVYFLSDGDPTDCCDVVLLDFLKKNLPTRIKVYTFSIGQQSPLMMRIAQDHGGTCTTSL